MKDDMMHIEMAPSQGYGRILRDSQEDLSWHRSLDDLKREQLAYAAEQKARYAPHRKYGFVKNLKK